jgi:predicted acyl esterase
MTRSAGVRRGERQLVGPQMTGRTYRHLSEPRFQNRRRLNLSIPMRGGVHLLADFYLPAMPERVPALLAIAPHARQAQYLGLPAGMSVAPPHPLRPWS